MALTENKKITIKQQKHESLIYFSLAVSVTKRNETVERLTAVVIESTHKRFSRSVSTVGGGGSWTEARQQVIHEGKAEKFHFRKASTRTQPQAKGAAMANDFDVI